MTISITNARELHLLQVRAHVCIAEGECDVGNLEQVGTAPHHAKSVTSLMFSR